ncbi:MAG: pyridoxal phosphate-dependent decarboxylase family protein [Chloroflexota bacterium]
MPASVGGPAAAEVADADARRARIRSAWDPAHLPRATDVALDRLLPWLRETDPTGVTLRRPADLVAEARALMGPGTPEPDLARFAAIVDLHLRTAISLQTTGSLARQFTSVLPVAGAVDLLAAMAPQPATFYEAGQLPNVADALVAEAFGPRIGWADGTYAMVATSGGALANLTAILAARNRHRPDAWTAGIQGPGPDGRRLAIAVGADAHYSVTRVAGIAGLGEDALVVLPVDAARRIDVAAARDVLAAAAADGRDVFCIVASAGSTPTGAIDPLDALADLAADIGAWLHVDGAHAGAFLVSDLLRPRLAGIERADSLCLDAHKTLFVPAACTLLFYRDRAAADAAFAQAASYVFDDPADEMARFESGGRNFECTKRPSILPLWTALALHGRQIFADRLEHLVARTEEVVAALDRHPDIVLAAPSDSNIVTFTYVPGPRDPAALSTLQVAIRDRLRADGRYLISKVDLGARTVLRLVVMHPDVGRTTIDALVAEIRRAARAIETEDAA